MKFKFLKFQEEPSLKESKESINKFSIVNEATSNVLPKKLIVTLRMK